MGLITVDPKMRPIRAIEEKGLMNLTIIRMPEGKSPRYWTQWLRLCWLRLGFETGFIYLNQNEMIAMSFMVIILTGFFSYQAFGHVYALLNFFMSLRP